MKWYHVFIPIFGNAAIVLIMWLCSRHDRRKEAAERERIYKEMYNGKKDFYENLYANKKNKQKLKDE